MSMILLAEDSHRDALAVQAVLHNAGVRNPITVVSDGDEAIEYLKGSGQFAERTRFPLPSVLLLDLKMARVDGFQVLDWIKRHPIPGKPLIVVLSGFDEAYKLSLAYSLGANSYLVKPCRLADIQNLINAFPHHWKLETDSPRPSGSTAGDKRNRNALD